MVSVDFVGRVNNTPLSPRQGLFPLFEAIFNSIHAIQEGHRDDGQIHITVKRDTENLLIKNEEMVRTAPIIGFEVRDNGAGFNNENFESFSICDTQKKRDLGGKGIGRFLWLKAFESVNVKSIFAQNGSIMERTFEYILNNEPIVNSICREVSKGSDIFTVIRLQDLKPEFLEHMPRSLEVVAYRIIEHCLEHFVLGLMPQISIQDENQFIDLVNIYKEMVSKDATTTFYVGEHHFNLFHFLLKAHPGMVHKLHYCAIHRVVDSKKLDYRTVPNLPSRIKAHNNSDETVYMGYLSSPFLDKHVNQQRSGFNTIEEDQIRFIGDLKWDEIETKALGATRNFLQPITEPVKLETFEQVQDFVSNIEPQYKGLLKYRPEIINSISPDIHQPQKLELELYKAQKQWEVDLRESAQQFISLPLSSDGTEKQKLEEKYFHFLEEWNENGKATLAKYVIHRKITLNLLEKHMQSDEDGGFVREKTIHQLIFPLKKTSDDISYEQQNLWVIDEKLSFHRYLASDLELRQLEPLQSEDSDRPDLLIFDNPIAMVEGEPINGITIFEFKRPMRKDSNPVSQMYGYVRKIRAGKACTNHNRSIVVRDETPFYCYAVCDLSNRLRNELEDMGMQKTPDNEGYFFYNLSLRAYVEVVSYDKLLRDAKQRNRILFEKLNLVDSEE